MRRLIAPGALLLVVAAILGLRGLDRGGDHGTVTTATGSHVAPTQRPGRSAVDWPTYGFNAARTHAAPFDLAPPFNVLWRQTGDWSLIEYPPVVADGRLFVGTNHGLLLALDAATGHILWRHLLHRCIASSPAGQAICSEVGRPPAVKPSGTARAQRPR